MPKSLTQLGPHTAAGAPAHASLVISLSSEFATLIRVDWTPPTDLRAAAAEFVQGVGPLHLRPSAARARVLTAIVARKLNLNRHALQSLWDAAAAQGRFFAPSTKALVADMFNRRRRSAFRRWLATSDLPAALVDLFRPVAPAHAIAALHAQLQNATINRSDARTGVQAERREAILRSIFGSWLFDAVDPRRARRFFSGWSDNALPTRYFDLLRRRYPSVVARSCGAIAIRIPGEWLASYSLPSIRDYVLRLIRHSYDNLSNHSYCGVLFEFPTNPDSHGAIWELISNTTLFAERLQSTRLKKKFYRPAQIADDTRRHIRSLDVQKAEFEAFQFGFIFRDCVVMCRETMDHHERNGSVSSAFVLLEKNEADETPIPCPACWSLNIGGNSYPAFGVRSWECHNLLCPERSAFDRGNRFSAVSILRNEGANAEGALIPEDSLREWKLDVVGPKSTAAILDMFVRHYSFPEDEIWCCNWPGEHGSVHGRTVVSDSGNPRARCGGALYGEFLKSPFFFRFLYAPGSSAAGVARRVEGTPSWLELYCGSCLCVLPTLTSASVDGAVTSPPYYNAREYSSWPNLYTYLYDMRRSAEEVYRVLRPGGYYLFNIFDNFDNDNIMATSALGKRRLCLGAYMTEIFGSCGFQIAGNIVWYKGEIEGKRNYNQGNRGPFFQLPLNAWEHILVLRKPGHEVQKMEFPGVVRVQPVIKWVRGENRHGHSAPFPESLPALLCSRLRAGGTVMDPFAGSLTTAIVAKRFGLKAVAIELHRRYCDVGVSRIGREEGMLPLGG